MRIPRKRVWCCWLLVGCLGFAAAAGSRIAWGQDEKKAEEPAAAAAPETAAPAATPAPEPVPDYFTGTNPAEPPAKWPDPTGANAGYWITPSPGPVGDGDPAKSQTIPSLYDRVAHNMFSINIVWTLVTGFLVMFMQAGFAFVEAGLGRAKNASHTMAMNFMIYPLGCFAFWAYGFAWVGATGSTARARRLVRLVGARTVGAQPGHRHRANRSGQPDAVQVWLAGNQGILPAWR